MIEGRMVHLGKHDRTGLFRIALDYIMRPGIGSSISTAQDHLQMEGYLAAVSKKEFLERSLSPTEIGWFQDGGLWICRGTHSHQLFHVGKYLQTITPAYISGFPSVAPTVPRPCGSLAGRPSF